MSDWQKRALNAEMLLDEVRKYAEGLQAEKVELEHRMHALVLTHLDAQKASLERTAASLIEVGKNATHIGCHLGLNAAAGAVSDIKARIAITSLTTEVEAICEDAIARQRAFVEEIAKSSIGAIPAIPAPPK